MRPRPTIMPAIPAIPTDRAARRPATRRPTLPAAVTAMVAVAAVAAGPGKTAAQASTDVTGTWDVTWDAGLRTKGDRVIAVTRRARAVLVLEQRGDSVAGTWTVPLTGDSHEVLGTVADDVLRLDASGATLRDGGREIPVEMSWDGRLEEGRLSGNLYLRLRPGPAPLRRWEAVRR